MHHALHIVYADVIQNAAGTQGSQTTLTPFEQTVGRNLSMDIRTKIDGTELTVLPSGKLDAQTSPEFEEQIKGLIADKTKLILDLADLAYVSSAGLRAILATYKSMSKHGSMVIRNAVPDVMDVFEMTGFVDLLNIEH